MMKKKQKKEEEGQRYRKKERIRQKKKGGGKRSPFAEVTITINFNFIKTINYYTLINTFIFFF